MKRICVFCGSNPGNKAVYRQAAEELGRLLAEKKLTLVYGGGNVGLMGIIADSVVAAGGEAVGVIPDFLVAKELAHPNLSALHIVTSMHERKAKMADLADGFIAMPGGFGTFEEFCEVLTWAQLGLHEKPHGLLNVSGYYDPLVRLFDQAVQEGFLGAPFRNLVLEADNPTALMAKMLAYQPKKLDKWEKSEEDTILKKF